MGGDCNGSPSNWRCYERGAGLCRVEILETVHSEIEPVSLQYNEGDHKAKKAVQAARDSVHCDISYCNQSKWPDDLFSLNSLQVPLLCPEA